MTTRTALVMIGGPFAMALVSIVPLTTIVATTANGQPISEETVRLSQLFADLKTFGYTEVADYNVEGTLVEFRSNGTIFLAQDVASNLMAQHGFELKEYAPAPALSEDSIIIIATVEGLTY
jgi:hypothetical protein